MTEATNAVVDYKSVSLVSGDDTGLKTFDLETSETYPIFSFGIEAGEGVILPKNKIRGTFLGTVPMFSKTFKENWDEITENGQTVYMSTHYAFEDAKGNKFGVFGSSTLWKLQKIPTLATGKAFVNPLVEVEYIGKVEGRETLEKEYGIKLTKGNSAHVFDVKTNAHVDPTVKGCINYLRNPVPNFGAEKNTISAIEVARQNWEKQQRLQQGIASQDALTM